MQKILGYLRKAVQRYDMLSDDDRVCVGVSGGKDSVVLLYGLALMKRFIGIDYQVVGLTLDPNFGGVQTDYSPVSDFCATHDIEYHVVQTQIGEIVFDIRKEPNPCSLCARMRRGYLYSHAQKMGCNKIALGHHYDDVIETILMGMLYSAQVQTMMPKLHSTNFEGMELIRPLYMVREDDIKAWRDYNDLHFIQCACKFIDTCTTCNNEENRSKRMEIKELIATLKKVNPYVEGNIFKSVENVNLDTVVAYKSKGEKHHFLDTYDEKSEEQGE